VIHRSGSYIKRHIRFLLSLFCFLFIPAPKQVNARGEKSKKKRPERKCSDKHSY